MHVLSALIVVLGVTAACGGGDHSSGGEVVLYTSMPDSVVDRLEGVIEQRFPDLDGNVWVPMDGSGISLRVVRGRTADIQELIAEEIEAGGIQADLIWLAEPSPFEEYKHQGLLAPLAPPPDAPIAEAYVDADGFYVAGRLISMVVAWNVSLQPQGLDDWPDLLEAEHPAFPAPASGAARATIRALADEFGWEFFSSMAAQGGSSVGSNGDARDGVVEGTFDVVAVLDYMARAAKEAGADVDFVYPSSGTVVIPSPIAITAGAANPGAAGSVVDFILSRPGQKIMVEIGDFYPVRADVDPPLGAPPIDTVTSLSVDWSLLATEIEGITESWSGLFGEG